MTASESPQAAVDAELVAGCVAQDQTAWERLVVRFGPRVAGAIRAALAAVGVRDSALEEELTADAFAEVAADGARALRGFRGDASLGTFLAVIATRVAGKALRRRAAETRARRVLADRVRSGGEGVAEDAAAPAEAGERAAAVVSALAEIKPRDRLLLSLFHAEGRSYREIAAAVGIAASGVGAELARARARLARKMEARGLGAESS